MPVRNADERPGQADAAVGVIVDAADLPRPRVGEVHRRADQGLKAMLFATPGAWQRGSGSTFSTAVTR